MGCVTDEYENTGCMGEENVKKDVWTGGRARNMEKKNWLGIEGDL
jgi:hypothetical protein